MELIKCFKALSDKTRLRLLYILQRFELNVNEIVQVVDMVQSGVSRHLKILTESGLLTFRRDGSFIYYAAAKNDISSTLSVLMDQSVEENGITSTDIEKSRKIIRDRRKRTLRFFKTVAPRWDRLKKEVIGDLDLNAIIIDKATFNGKISDLGCGTGELMAMLSIETTQNLIGIDSSPEMLEQARLRLSKAHNAELRLGELEHLPMKNHEVDSAIMNMVLHHVSQPERSIAEAYRVLKPGGTFFLADFEKHDKEEIKKVMGGSWFGFEKEKIQGWLMQTGFHLTNIDSYPVHHGLIINIFTVNKKHRKQERI